MYYIPFAIFVCILLTLNLNYNLKESHLWRSALNAALLLFNLYFLVGRTLTEIVIRLKGV